MGDEFTWNDRYAGDEAWTEWFEICSVDLCRPEFAARLREQVSAALYSRLARAGISREDAGGEDPVAFFDSYFKLKGSREKKKPLKSYFAHRIKDEGLEMVDFVCGTLFGSGSGRVRVWAKSLGAKEVWTGVSEADFSGYPDCRAAFIRAHEKATRLALDWPVKFVTPFIHKTKAEEWALAAKLGILDVIENNTLTCYNGIPGRGCGKCPACRLRARGYKEFGMWYNVSHKN